jgi:hypothetical protein
VPLTVYAAVWLLVRQRGAALLAAFLVALPFFFPAYYATWGRLTQLTAVLILPILLAATWRVPFGGWDGRRGWWLVGLLVAGLCLIHFRVFPLLPALCRIGLAGGAGRRTGEKRPLSTSRRCPGPAPGRPAPIPTDRYV